jgi:dTDP-4-amino-4,6-dideoxygalactose transaminase
MTTNNPFEIVDVFEKRIAELAGSKYAVAVDCCTNALFLCLKYINSTKTTITIPKHTYVGVPSSIRNAGYNVVFEDIEWTGVYQLKPLPIYDGALRFQKNMYSGGFHCLSFHIKKHLKIGRGGMILTNDETAYKWFKLARFNGRSEVVHKNDTFKMIGWNYYMTNYDAARGLWLLAGMNEDVNMPDIPVDYPDLSRYNFNEYEPGEFFSENKK